MYKNFVGTYEIVRMESHIVPWMLENSFFAQCVTMISMLSETPNYVCFIMFNNKLLQYSCLSRLS